jgi:hypothetical protein
MTSFARDIAGILAPYRDNMLWRFDLADYAAVKANAELIHSVIEPAAGNPMPPPPLPPIRVEDAHRFQDWIDEGCPP